MRFIILIGLVLGVLSAESRYALLIGNSDYPNKRLTNPTNDVDLLAKKLKGLGFTVIKKKNLNRSSMINELRNFYNHIDSDTIAIIYFSGHGVHSTIDNRNYLIPIGGFESLLNEADLGNEAISDGKLLASTSGAKFSILLLDACRSNDFAKIKGDKGLGQPQSGLNNDYVISYATEVGKTAKDGYKNSPYAKALAELLTQPYSIGDIFTKVRAKVSADTRGKQKPYYAPHFENILYLSKKKDSKGITVIDGLSYQNQPFSAQDKRNFDNQKEGGRAWSWSGAKKYCKNLTLGGYSDWRLPTKSELKKLLTKNKNGNSSGYQYYIKKEFVENMPPLNGRYSNASFWSSTENDSSVAWSVLFGGGNDLWLFKTVSSYALCVR